MATDEDYFRKYLDDPIAINSTPTPQQPSATQPTDSNITYYRKYLDDPQ